MEVKKIFLPESELPTQWYNIAADMPTPMEPPLHPGTGPGQALVGRRPVTRQVHLLQPMPHINGNLGPGLYFS